MASTKYGKVTTENGSFEPDEPVFIIRARDFASVGTLAEYYKLCQKFECSPIYMRDLVSVIGQFADWQYDHWEQMKVPD